MQPDTFGFDEHNSHVSQHCYLSVGQTLVPYQCVVRRADWEQMRTSFLEDVVFFQWELYIFVKV